MTKRHNKIGITIKVDTTRIDRDIQMTHIGIDLAKSGHDHCYLIFAKIVSGHVALEVIEEFVNRGIAPTRTPI